MNKYLIDYSIPLPGESKYNATVARMDVVKTFLSIGADFINWHPLLTIPIPKVKGYIWKLGDIYQALKTLSKFNEGDDVYFQYPHLGQCLTKIIKLIKQRRAKVILIIHDLEFLRYPNMKGFEKQINLLNSVDRLLVHTPQMKKRLFQLGVKTRMDYMTLFDYYAEDPYRDINALIADKNVIAFAGNLNKSIFLRKLDKSVIPIDFTFNFYGIEPKIRYNNNNINYKGKFQPKHTGKIHAGWGLVWDGDSINTCSGTLGEYLKMIAPHKLSLYLASGIPVIVWNKCAHAQFVKDNNIGLTVEKISDAYCKINSISNTQYKEMVINARKIGDRLRKGIFLKRLIDNNHC